MRKVNVLRKLLSEGKPTFGTHIVTPWPGTFEIVGNSGVFDYVEYISEYSPWTLPLLDDIGRTMELFPNMATMIKIDEQSRAILTSRALDSGFQSVLFADVRTADDVRECIRFVRAELPDTGGIHGTSGRRHSGGYGGARGGSATEEWVKEMNDVVIVVMIEKKAAMINLEGILSVKGIDMVQFGPSDYSISIGKPGQIMNPETQQAEREMIKLALEKGIAVRVETGDPKEAKAYFDMGVRNFCVGTDTMILSDWCKQQANGSVKSMLSK
jgi:4-hydroxy-2-oxoheptanedioate aldolase